MELTESQQLAYLIESLATSGTKELDKPNLKKLKSICKKSHEHVRHAFHLLLTQLEAEHSEIRLGALLVVDVLFQRSHVFRELLLDNFHDFLELTAETNFDMPLPEPRNIGKEVIKKTLILMKSWCEKFGPAYKKLELGYNFLKGTKKIQLVNADEVQTQIQRNAQEERDRRKDAHNKKRLKKVVDEVDSSIHEIQSCIAEIEACFSLLVPNFDEVGTDDAKQFEDLRESGFLGHDYKIELDLSADIFNFIKVKESNDNGVILENLRDRETVLRNIYIPKVKRWLACLGACGAPSDVLKRVIDVKLMMTKSLEKSKDLVIDRSEGKDNPSTSGISVGKDAQISDNDSSDDDFIEVQEKPLFMSLAPSTSSTIVQHLKEDNNDNKRKVTKIFEDTNIWKPIRTDDSLDDPTSYLKALTVQKERLKELGKETEHTPPTKFQKLDPRKISDKKQGNKSMVESAPIVPFGRDLLEWDEVKKQELKETLTLGAAQELDIGHRFYGSDTAAKGDSGVSDAALAAVTTRSIPFIGEFEPVKWSCRAPLPSGRLCPRRDRFKCPFHGPIIPRDANGNPTNKKDIKQSQVATETTEDWQDPALLRELKALTGIDLKMPEKRAKKKRSKKKEYENLTNIKEVKNTSRFRLQKKVLDPKSLKRVSETLDTLDTKRTMQKFGNNFNYALN